MRKYVNTTTTTLTQLHGKQTRLGVQKLERLHVIEYARVLVMMTLGHGAVKYSSKN